MEDTALIRPMEGNCRFELAYVIGGGEDERIDSGDWRDHYWLVEVIDDKHLCGRLKVDPSIGESRRLAELLVLLHDALAAKNDSVQPIHPDQRQYLIQEYMEAAKQAYQSTFRTVVERVVHGPPVR